MNREHGLRMWRRRKFIRSVSGAAALAACPGALYSRRAHGAVVVNVGSKDRLMAGMKVVLFSVDASGRTKKIGEGSLASVSSRNSNVRVSSGAPKVEDVVVTK